MTQPSELGSARYLVGSAAGCSISAKNARASRSPIGGKCGLRSLLTVGHFTPASAGCARVITSSVRIRSTRACWEDSHATRWVTTHRSSLSSLDHSLGQIVTLIESRNDLRLLGAFSPVIEWSGFAAWR